METKLLSLYIWWRGQLFFWVHHREVHGAETTPGFIMKVEKSVKGNFERQAPEGRLIGTFKGEYPLKGKGEWG